MCIYTEREEVDCWMREGMCTSARSNTMRSACLRKFRKFSFISGMIGLSVTNIRLLFRISKFVWKRCASSLPLMKEHPSAHFHLSSEPAFTFCLIPLAWLDSPLYCPCEPEQRSAFTNETSKFETAAGGTDINQQNVE